jgi:hypothetical protein
MELDFGFNRIDNFYETIKEDSKDSFNLETL